MEYLATAEPTNITSPGYPNKYNYPNDVNSCITTLYANEGQPIALEFEEFDIEDHSRCRYDYLEVLNGIAFYTIRLGKKSMSYHNIYSGYHEMKKGYVLNYIAILYLFFKAFIVYYLQDTRW